MATEVIATDVIHYAAQLGRLDLISTLLAVVAILMGLGGIVAFLNIKMSAKDTAREVAREVAEEEAERIANNYIQANLPDIIAAYKDMIKDEVNAAVSNDIAQAQEEDR